MTMINPVMQVEEEATAIDGSTQLSGYIRPMEHLSDELSLLDLKLRRKIVCEGNEKASEAYDKSDYFISEAEVLSQLSSGPIMKGNSPHASAEKLLDSEIRKKGEEIAERISATDEPVMTLPLYRLSKIFGLDMIELSALVAAVAPDTDRKYERIFAYFNNDLNKKTPSLHLILSLHLPSREVAENACRYFSGRSPLLKLGLLRFVDANVEEGFLSTRVKADDRVKHFIMSNDFVCPSSANFSSIKFPSAADAFESQPASEGKIINAITSWHESRHKSVVCWLYGEGRDEKELMAQSVGKQTGMPIISASLDDISKERDAGEALNSLFRNAVLHSAIILFRDGIKLHEDGLLLSKTFLSLLNDYSWFVIVCDENLWVPERLNEEAAWLPFKVKCMSFSERHALWAKALSGSGIDPREIEVLASRFRLKGRQITNAVTHATISSGGERLTLNALMHSCKLQSPPQLGKFTKKVEPSYGWKDLVLPEDKLAHLKEACSFIKNKYIVYYRWGFEEKLALGKGLNVLFLGASGTGKTMTAEIMAKELELDIYKTDLSSIVSKYIGETEKNLSQIFNETSSGNTILFFDEADALFGKRSEVKDAHDRYANIETNYLLQKIEEHEGVVILSTNLSNNIDGAFLRRMHFSIEFPFPEKKERQLIWGKVFPEDAPLSDNLDFTFLSEKLKVAGGNIKNIALLSASLAADDGGIINMAHLIHAARREYKKMGKNFVQSDFGKYTRVAEV